MTEIADFAGALRQMADNAEALAERHDIAEIAGLRRQVDGQAARAQRDADLIDELRRQLLAHGNSLDAIGRLRKSVLAGDRPADVVQILVDALLLIDGGCESFTSGRCRDAGRIRFAPYTAEAWCQSCVAHDALERAGALPAGVDR